MAKTDATKRRKEQTKVVRSEAVEEEDNINTEEQTETDPASEQRVEKVEDAPTKNTEMTQDEEKQDEQDSQVDTVIKVKGNTSTVTVVWDEKNEGGVEEERDGAEKTANESVEIMDDGEQTQIVSSADAVGSTADAAGESTETEMNEESECQMDIIVGAKESAPAVTVTWEEKNEEGEGDDVKKEINGKEEMIVKEKKVKGKRKAPSTVETSPSKKTKPNNDGFCLYIGNLNHSKTFEEVKNSLANYLMTQSVLVQDIRLDRSRKHAHLDLASQMDLTKALTLNGEMVLDKPMKIDKAKIKTDHKVKVSAEDKKAAKDAKCLFLKNVPYNATKQDIMKVFGNAVDVRFPGGAESPKQGIAFVEFKNKDIAKKIQQKKRLFKIQDRILTVDFVGQARGDKVAKPKDDKKTTKAEALPNRTLFLSNLSFNVKENKIRNVYKNAVKITIPQSKGKSRGFAFVKFATVADAEKAMKTTQNMKLCKREMQVQFCDVQEKPEKAEVVSNTLIVVGLTRETSAETLKNAFDGAINARVITDKDTGASKKFGFVEFESAEDCKAVKEAMEDCEIDGSKVTVAYAKPKAVKGHTGVVRGGLTEQPVKQPAGQKAAKAGRKKKGGKGSKGGKAQGATKVLGAV